MLLTSLIFVRLNNKSSAVSFGDKCLPTRYSTSTKRWMSSKKKNPLFVFGMIVFLSTATWAQVPSREKVVAGAERGFEKFTRAYVAPGPGCAAAGLNTRSNNAAAPAVRILL